MLPAQNKISKVTFYLFYLRFLYIKAVSSHCCLDVADMSINLKLWMNSAYYFGTLDVYDKIYYLLSQTQLKSNLGDNNYKNSDCRPNFINKWAIRWNNSPISPKNELIWAAKRKNDLLTPNIYIKLGGNRIFSYFIAQSALSICRVTIHC